MAVLIIFIAATQLGLHFWPLSSLVYGIRIDYLSPTLYFLDLLIILYLALSKSYILNPKFLSILPILLTNLLFSQNPLATLNWSLHFLLYSSFVFLLKIDTIKVIPKILLVSLIFQLTLGLVQVYLGHSVGGLMYYVGERMVAVGTPGIATTSFMGQVVLRAYGTFSHPNIFAGWSIIMLLVVVKLRPQLKNIAIILSTLIVFLTDSRSATLALFGIILPLHFLHSLKSRLIYFLIIIFTYFFALPLPSLTRTDLSISERLNLQQVSIKVVSTFPIFGTGSQSSISTYPALSPTTRLLQPDHNSFTLFFSWFGIFGVLAILFTLQPKLSITSSILAPLAPLLVLDHYLLTSPQGLFVLLLYLQVAVNYTHAQKDRK